MQITLKSTVAKILAITLQAVLFLASVFWIGKTYLADLVARKPVAQNLQLAIRLDPGDSSYHRGYGRLLQYDLTDAEPAKALYELRLAAQLNPKDPQAWLDLGLAQELQGNAPEAEVSLRQADFLAPNLPLFQWSIANFFLLHGNVDEALHHFRVVLAGSQDYDRLIFNTAWKASGDGDKILAELIPNNVRTNFSYLDYLLATQKYTDADAVWRRIAANPEPFPPPYAGGYLDTLVGMRRPDAAYQVWTDLRRKGLIRATEEETEQNRIINGDFEEGLPNLGFDWRVYGVDGVVVSLDQTTFRSAGHSLMIQFLGKQNLEYTQLFQFARVRPGYSYRLSWAMKTEGITTDSGPRFEVRDYYDAHQLDKYSDSVTGTTGWTSSMLDFAAGPKTDLVMVAIRRLPSRKLDNLITGKVWVDDVSLVPVTGEAAQAKE